MNISHIYFFASESKPGKTYQTLVYVDRSMTCDCPGWKFKKKTVAGQRTCKHVRIVAAGLGEDQAVRVTHYGERASVKQLASVSAPTVIALRPARLITLEDE